MSSFSRTLKARRSRANQAYELLGLRHPDAKCALNHSNAFQLLVATVLSAQTTDIRVNTVTPELFRQFPDPKSLAKASLPQVEYLLRTIGFFRSKAKSIVGLSIKLCEDFNGEVPSEIDALTSLPGVGRKTANVVRGEFFGIPGLTVDTHLGRIARRLWITQFEDPKKVEMDLSKILEPEYWNRFNQRVIFHGRRVCHARKPACGACVIVDICPSAGIGPLDSVEAEKLVKNEAAVVATILPSAQQ